MTDRKGWKPPRDADGTPLIDTAAAKLITGHHTLAGFRVWARAHGVTPRKRGAHGAHLWRHADIIDILNTPHDPAVSSE